MGGKEPSSITDNPDVPVPKRPGQVAEEHSEIWAAFQALGAAVSAGGPLDARSRRLTHLALAIGADSEGATHSHARRAISEGLSPPELEHVALLAITTIGWPRAMRALSWIQDVTRCEVAPGAVERAPAKT